MSPITIVVIDDHPLFREGVVLSLSKEDGFLVVGQADRGEEGLEFIKEHQPNVAIVDVNLPGMNGQHIAQQVVHDRIPTKVILLTAYDDMEQQIHAIRAGASAYCSKDIQPDELIRIITKVVHGATIIKGHVLEPELKDTWLSEQSEKITGYFPDPGDPFRPLSVREMEVLTFISKGFSNKEIASIMGISHQTVKNHVTAILRKLGVEDRTQAALYALRRGWINLFTQVNKIEE